MSKAFQSVYQYITDSGLDYWDRTEELEWLYDMGNRWIYSHREKVIEAVELGTYMGTTALCLAMGMKSMTENYRLTTVDKCIYASKDKVIENISKFNADLNTHINFIEADDLEFLKSIPDNHIDMLYIDTLHTLEHMRALLPICFNKMKHGGLLFGHDYTPEFAGVVEAVTEFREDNSYFILGNGQDYSIWWILKR